jgi:hypothetical protein
MRLAMRMLPLLLVFAVLSPAEARTPQVFDCRADVTLTFGTESVSQLAWQWWISSGSGVCKTVPATQKFDVTIVDAGGPIFASEPVDLIFGFDLKLRLKGRTTGERRSYLHFWEGARINCKRGPFVTLLRGFVPVGTGNLRYCGPIPDGPPINEESHPGSVTWTFVGK